MRNLGAKGGLAALLSIGLVVGACSSSTPTPAASTAGSPAASAGEDFIIGFAAGLTGDAAVGDVPALAAMQWQADQINAAGGFNGHKVKIISKNMESNPALGGTVTQELIDAGADIIVGPAFDGMASGVVQVATQHKIPVLGAVSTQANYTKIGGADAKAFLIAFSDQEQGTAAGMYAIKQGYKTAVLLESPDLSYLTDVPEAFSKSFTSGGGKIVGTQTFKMGQTSFDAQVTAIAAMNPQPDVIESSIFPPDVTPFLRALRAAGVKSAFIGADGLDSVDALNAIGADMNGTVFSTHVFAGDAKAFVTSYTTWNKGKAPESVALGALGADTVTIAVEAAKKAGSFDGTALATALAGLENIQCITGSITYKGTNGVPIKQVALVKVDNLQFVKADSIVP